jgi:hypothetical protein
MPLGKQNLGGTRGRCELECGGQCAQKPFGSRKFPQDPHGATQPSHNGLGPNGNWFGCGGIYLEWGIVKVFKNRRKGATHPISLKPMPIQNFQLIINCAIYKMKDSHSLKIEINQQFLAYGNGSIQGIIQEPITSYLIQNTLFHD